MKIESNIPIPGKGSRALGVNARLIESMQVGDSVFFKDQATWSVYSRYFNVAKRQGKHIIVRSVDGGTRMWRDK